MTRPLSHDEAFAALDAAALDALDPTEREAVLAHAAQCGTCRDELLSLRATASNLAFVAPSRLANDSAAASRERIRSRLMARVAADAEAGRGESSAAPIMAGETRSWAQRVERRRLFDIAHWRRAEWVAVAAAVLFVVSAALLAAAVRDRQSVRDALRVETARAARARTSSDSMRTLVAARDSLIAGITGRDVAVVQLTSSAARTPRAMMFWDRARNAWTFIAHNLPAPAPGRVYQLWLVTPTSKVSAGTFTPTNGEAMVRATYPLARDSLRAVAVTDEPAGGMPQPTGKPVVLGTMQ